MKYLAILRDSFREAIDSKVLYVLLGLWGLVILFVAMMSFRPLPAVKMMEQVTNGSINFALDALKKVDLEGGRKTQPIGVPFGFLQLRKVEVTRGAPDSPDSDYVTTVALPFSTLEDAAKAQAHPAESVKRIESQLNNIVAFGLLEVDTITPAESPLEIVGKGNVESYHVLFQITTKPTSTTRRLWPTEPSLFFGAIPLSGDDSGPLGLHLAVLATFVLSIGSWVAILTSVIVTSFFIPNMLRKGTIDLLLTKPVHRLALLLYKYIGGLTFVFFNNVVAVGGIWLALGLRSGVWANWSLLLIFVLTFFFAVLYAISTLFGVLTRSIVASIMITCGAWFIFFLIGATHQFFELKIQEEERKTPAQVTRQSETEVKWVDKPFGKVVKAIHVVTPRTSDLGYLGNILVQTDFITGDPAMASKLSPIKLDWGESLLVSGIFIALMLTLACWWFTTRDY